MNRDQLAALVRAVISVAAGSAPLLALGWCVGWWLPTVLVVLIAAWWLPPRRGRPR